MQQKEQSQGAREGKGTLKKMKDMREGMYGKKKRCSLETECAHERGEACDRTGKCTSERESMQDSMSEGGKGLHEGGKVCPREGKYKQGRQRESTTNRGKVQESEGGKVCKRGKAHTKEGKHTTEREGKHACKRGKT